MAKVIDYERARAALSRLERMRIEKPHLFTGRWAAFVERLNNDAMAITKEERGMKTYGVKTAAETLGVAASTIRREIERGALPAAKVGGVYKISDVELAGYFRARGGGELFASADAEGGPAGGS